MGNEKMKKLLLLLLGSAVQAWRLILTEEERIELFSEWKGRDTNYISVDDFPSFLDVWMAKKGNSRKLPEEFSKMLTLFACPENDDEKSPITVEAFLELAALVNGDQRLFARKTFAYFDKDESGGISRRELRLVAAACEERHVSDKVINQAFEKYNVDGDKELNIDEFEVVDDC